MTFRSILFEGAGDRPSAEPLAPPVFFADLNLDQIVAAITAGRQEYNLAPFFHQSLPDIDSVLYRHEVMRDLEQADVLDRIKSFAGAMHAMRETLKKIEKLYYKHQKEALFLDAVAAYCAAVTSLTADLGAASLRSRGLLSFRDYLAGYAGSDSFTSLVAETKDLKADLSTVKYTLQIKGGSITVRKYDSEVDYAAEVEQTFHKFRQGEVSDYRAKFIESAQMNNVEAAVMDRVAKLYSEIFANVNAYCERHSSYLDDTICRFDREIQFYIAYLDYLGPLQSRGTDVLLSDAFVREQRALRS